MTKTTSYTITNRAKFQSKALRVAVYGGAILTVALIALVLLDTLIQGVPNIVTEAVKLVNGEPSIFTLKYNSENASMMPALFNTLILIAMSVSLSTVLGIGTAIYLVEYANSDNRLVQVIRVTSETLSGIPSIIYGLFGMIFFVTYTGLGFSVISGVLTIAIMILPLIIRSTEEALKAVPLSYREASFGLGAAKLRTIFTIVLPSAMNGILAGIILAIGRVMGETAALLYTAGTTTNMATNPLTTGGRTLSVHMYMLTGEGIYFPQARAIAAILLLIILGINALSTFLARRLMKGTD